MRPRVIALVASLALAGIGGLLACSSFDAGATCSTCADAAAEASDASPIVAGDAADGGTSDGPRTFCSDFTSALFCADFDNGRKIEDYGFEERKSGVVGATPIRLFGEAFSPPLALDFPFPGDEGEAKAAVIRPFPRGAVQGSTFEIQFALLRTKQVNARLVELDFLDDVGALKAWIAIADTSSGLTLRAFDEAGGVAVLELQFDGGQLGEWHAFTLRLAKLAGLSISVDGAASAATPLSNTVFDTAGPLRLELGVVVAGPSTPPFNVRFDDVLVQAD